MVTILVDANLDGHAELLAMQMATESWAEFRDYLDIRFFSFEDVGLDRETKDDVIWRLCQRQGFYLLTSNRNEESEDSLQATIRRENSISSLPVLTLADAQRLYHSSAYLDKVTEKILDCLLNQENYRGAGRLFLP
jgi:hypothetical protein